MATQTKKTNVSTKEIVDSSKKGNIESLDEQLSNLESILNDIKGDLGSAMAEYQLITNDVALSDAERRRLLGSGVRRYGFIDKVSDIGSDNPEFTPPFLNFETLKDLIRHIETVRNLAATLQQLVQANSELLLTMGDEAFRMALLYYNSVRDAARLRVPGAKPIFQALELFFRRPRRTSNEPTEPEVERDVKALLHGKKDGKIVIENERPVVSGGKHVVLDDVYSGHAAVKETMEEEIRE